MCIVPASPYNSKKKTSETKSIRKLWTPVPNKWHWMLKKTLLRLNMIEMTEFCLHQIVSQMIWSCTWVHTVLQNCTKLCDQAHEMTLKVHTVFQKCAKDCDHEHENIFTVHTVFQKYAKLCDYTHQRNFSVHTVFRKCAELWDNET